MQWGCREHWGRLPLSLRDKIWSTYKAGCPTPEYYEVMQEVRAWIREYDAIL